VPVEMLVADRKQDRFAVLDPAPDPGGKHESTGRHPHAAADLWGLSEHPRRSLRRWLPH